MYSKLEGEENHLGFVSIPRFGCVKEKDLKLYYFDCTDDTLKVPTVAVYIDNLLFDDETNGRNGKIHLENMHSFVNAVKKKGVF